MTHFGILARQQLATIPCVYSDKNYNGVVIVSPFWNSDIQPKVMRSELNLWILEGEFPVGILDEKYKKIREMSGLAGLKFTVSWIQQETAT